MRDKPVVVGLIAVLALATSLVMTAVVLGHTEKTVLRDARNPNLSADCDILKATAQVVKKGRVARHTVTVRGALPYDNAAPLVWLAKSRTSDLFTDPADILHPSESEVRYRFADNHRTVVYKIHKRDLPGVFRKREKYFWFASVSCGGSASDSTPGLRHRQVLKRHDHH
jgi:hypothetical protein